MGTHCRIELLGGLKVVQGDRVMTRFPTRKTGALLAYLAYYRRSRHAREALIELFWPEMETGAGRRNLSQALYCLRRQLVPPGVPAAVVLQADHTAVGLNPDVVTTDVAEFEAALDEARHCRSPLERARLLSDAVALYSGELLPGHYDDWVDLERERLQARYDQGVADLEQTRPRPSVAMRAPARGPGSHAALPAGTITFLLADGGREPGEGQHGGDSAAGVPPDVLRAHRGHLVTQADGAFVLAFRRASDALACALACRQACGADARMALTTVDARLVGGRYDEAALSRAIRVLASGHAGQLLCSEATAVLVRRSIPSGSRLTDLGLYRLQGTDGPERLFQVEVPGLPRGTFPPLRAAAGYASNLPADLTRFFGREDELARLLGFLQPPLTTHHSPLTTPPPRLVTLAGPGGTGKTRLALAAARLLLEPFHGAVWFVPLADVAAPHLIAGAIAHALHLSRSPNEDPLEQSIEFLAHQPSLLFLDNLEHLLDGAAPLVLSLLERLPGLTCLVTSRQVLDVPGEQEFAVGPLPVPADGETAEGLACCASVRLFTDRTQSSRPDFRVTGANAGAVAEICRRLEGMPLALELAAARGQVMGPARILRELRSRLDFLVSHKRGVPERHLALRAAIRWSYDLLSAEQQRLLARLSVFRGSWSMEAATSICDFGFRISDSPEAAGLRGDQEQLAGHGIADGLAQLRQCSLIQAEEAGEEVRFRMLEAVREFAAEQMAPEERALVEERHAAYFRRLLEQVDAHMLGPEQQAWLRRLFPDRHNVGGAAAWAGDSPRLDPPWEVVPGLGRISLSDSPGSLRCILQGPVAGSPYMDCRSLDEWQAVTGRGAESTGGWTMQTSLGLARPFEGERWALRVEATYHLRAVLHSESTGVQALNVYVLFGKAGEGRVRIKRGVDRWHGHNGVEVGIQAGRAERGRCCLLDPPPMPDRVAETCTWEIARDGLDIAVRRSRDSAGWETLATARLDAPVPPVQRLIIDTNVWSSVGSYVDIHSIDLAPDSDWSRAISLAPWAATSAPTDPHAQASVPSGPLFVPRPRPLRIP